MAEGMVVRRAQGGLTGRLDDCLIVDGERTCKLLLLGKPKVDLSAVMDETDVPLAVITTTGAGSREVRVVLSWPPQGPAASIIWI